MAAKPSTPERDRERFFDRLVKLPSGCWSVGGYVDTGGYNRIYFDGHQITAHRAAHMIFKGPIPPGYHVDHLCRNRVCVNPDHIEAVTQAENTRRGARAKLNREQALEIRAMLGGPIKSFMNRFSVSAECVAQAATGISWSDV